MPRGGLARPRRFPAVVNGDLVVSMERVAEQARRFRVTRGEELARLVVHGALHLAGLDHHRAAERRHMRAREDAALAAARAATRRLEAALRGAALAAARTTGRPRRARGAGARRGPRLA